MKKFFYSLLLLVALALQATPLKAQQESKAHAHELEHEHTSSWFVGGVASYWYNTDTKTHQLHLHPEFGYFFNDTWAVGLIAGYGLEQEVSTTSEVTLQHEFKVSPFVRYYYHHNGPFNLYIDGNVGYSYEIHGAQRHQGLEIGLRPGACLDLTEGLCLCLRMGFLGYRKSFHGEEPSIPASGWGLSFTPEHLQIGLELEF